MAAWGLLAGPGLVGCARREEPLLRIASNVFPGYELMYLAAEQGYFSPEAVRMVEMPSATAALRALAADTVEGVALTLDEVLNVRADGLPLKVVAVLDLSLGADVVLVRPGLRTLADLRGKRIGVEQTAVGAVLLDAALSQAGLGTSDVTLVYATVDQHRALYLNGQVDALVTFEPVPSLLKTSGVRKLFSSADIPGRIMDVLALRPEALERSPQAVRELIAGHFSARQDLKLRPEQVQAILARRLNMPPAEVPSAFDGLDLPDAAANQAWLSGQPSRLETAAADLQAVMLRAGLLAQPTDLRGLADARFLPEMTTP